MNKEIFRNPEEKTELEIDYYLAVYYYHLLTLEDAKLGLDKGIEPIEAWKQKGTGELGQNALRI